MIQHETFATGNLPSPPHITAHMRGVRGPEGGGGRAVLCDLGLLLDDGLWRLMAWTVGGWLYQGGVR